MSKTNQLKSYLDEGFQVASDTSNAKVTKSFVDDFGNVRLQEGWSVGSPAEVKKFLSPNIKGEQVKCEHAHNTKILTREVRKPTTGGMLKFRETVELQTDDVVDGMPLSVSSPKSIGSNPYSTPQSSEHSPATLKNMIDNILEDIRGFRAENNLHHVLIALAAVVGIILGVIALTKIFG